jgi:hypothetical protein
MRAAPDGFPQLFDWHHSFRVLREVDQHRERPESNVETFLLLPQLSLDWQ